MLKSHINILALFSTYRDFSEFLDVRENKIKNNYSEVFLSVLERFLKNMTGKITLIKKWVKFENFKDFKLNFKELWHLTFKFFFETFSWLLVD